MISDEYTREHTKERVIRKSVNIDAPVAQVWWAWTTPEGIATFFAPRAHIVLAAGGAYELYIMTDSPEGKQGSEGCEVIGYEVEQRLSFTWNAPPEMPTVREERTIVEIHFEEIGPERTSLVLTHSDWKEGEEWDRAYNFFDKAWDGVLANLQRSFSEGPMDWSGG